MKNFLQVIRALAAKKNSRLVNRALAAKKNSRLVIRALAAEKNSRLVNRALAAEKNVFTLNSLSNPDGQPTVKRQSAVALQSGTRSEKAPLSPSCLQCASYMPPTCPRPDSLSLVSRQSDLDQVRAVSVGLSARVWKHVAMIFAVLVMSVANIGTAWGASGVINAASTTDLGKGNTPRYVVEQAGVGRLMKNATGSSSWSASDGKLTTGSNLFALQTYNAISSIVINGYGTGNGRTFSSMRVGTATNNYAAASATGSGTMSSTAESQTITITPSSTIAANSYVEITLSGNVNIYSVELVYASSCAATANAGADKSTTVGVGVAMAATAASSGYTGAWSIKTGSPSTATSQLSSTSSATATFTPNTYGTYTLVWTVTDNEDGSCSATDEATVTVPAPTHSITYTNLKGADNSANPATYTEGVGVASFANLRHVVGYDFTGWSPSSISSSATTDQTIDAQWTARAAATGTGTLTYALAFGTSTITTSSITRNNGALYDATDVSIAHTSFNDGAAKNGCSGKLTTTEAKDASNYVELTFKIADGYTFTPTEVQVRGNAVSTAKTMEVELKDNAATPNTKSVSGSLAAGSTDKGTTVTLDFDASGTVTLEGTVTLKIFVYGATNHWRLGTSIIVNGTVASAAPSCSAPNHVDVAGRWDRFAGETISLTATAYSSEGTGSPITSGITGYQWQKLLGSTWTNVSNGGTISGATAANLVITNCTKDNSGKYRCIVSTGATCSTASATATDGTEGFGVKVFTLDCYNGGVTSYNFTRVGNTDAGTVTVNLAASTSYEFEVVGDDVYYGNTGTINKDETNWEMTSAAGHLHINSGLGGTFSFTMDYGTGGNNSTRGVPELSVTYPRKTIYLSPGVWANGDGEKYAIYYYLGGTNGWSAFMTDDGCGYSTEIPQWNGVTMIAGRINGSLDAPEFGDGKCWNQTSDITVTANNLITITDWSAHTYGTYTAPLPATSLQVDSKTSSSATLSWDPLGAGANGYSIKLTGSGTGTFDWTNCATNSFEATGLDASTTYTFHVKSKGAGDCTSEEVTIEFTTNSVVATPMVIWNLNVGTTATTAIFSSGDSDDHTNIPVANITVDQTNDGANGDGASDRTTKLAIKTGANGADWSGEPTNYVLFTFKVGCGKKLTPSKISIPVANVGGSSANNIKYKAVLSDTYGHSLSGTYVVTTQDGTVESFEINNSDATKYFQGVVTLKLWAWTIADKDKGGSAFRMGTPVEIYGAIGNQATPAATITWNTQPANGRVGDPDFAYDVTCSDGSTVTVTSANTTYATIVGGKLHYAAAGTTHLVATATDACGNVLTPVNSNNFTVSAAAATYSVTHSLTNVTATSGATGAGAATEGVAYNAVFAASSGYVLPSTITVTIGGSPATVGTGYTWNASTGAFQVPAAQVTGAIVITIEGETAPATKDIYYGQVAIADGALVREITNGTIQFFTNIGGTVANTTEISLTSTPSTTGMYYNSNNLTDTELSKSSNWNTSSGSNRYIRGLKFANGATYTLALGSKVASSIKFYGWCGSASKTMTVGGEEFTSSATKNTFAKHEFIKTGGFTGNVSITQDGGDFYGILVITIQTATPCTTPVLPTLADQGLCEGADIAAWDATVTNASAISAAGETVTYSWKKKGNATELANTASFDLGASAAESQAGTYVVTVTVSKTGYASSTATKEVTLSVTDGIEVKAITADKATVYPTNSVTLTATASADATWQWYTCTNAEGDGESSIGGATNASYTIASAGVAGTYYYKAKATSSCGNAERVYTLTVSQPSECEKYFWFVYAADATTNGVVNNRDGFFTSAPTGSSNSSTYKFTLDGTEYKATKNTGSGSFSISFTIPAGSTATMGINCKGSSSKPLYLTHSSGTPQKLVSNSSSNASCTVEDITEGTWTLTSAGSWTLAALGVQVCTTSTCTDATPTIAAANTTVCVGGELSITATGYETSPESIQWQKLNSSTSTWDNISGAKSATYTVATAAAEHAGSYRLVATKECARTSNTVTIAVPSAPVFNSFTATRSVMATLALSITDVEASDATSYAWYKSADATYDAGTDTKVGTAQELLLASGGEAAGATYYLFCVASNACGSTTSSAITVNVTALVEEDCATKGNEGAADFGFTKESGVGDGSVSSQSCWTSGGKAKYLTYTAPDGKYFDNAKVTVAVSSGSVAAYGYSTDGSSYTYANLTGLSSALAEKTIDLPANVTHFRIGRNFDPSYGVTSGTFYLRQVCFEYTDACTATTVTPSKSSVNYEMGGAWTNPTFTVKHGGTAFAPQPTLTYSSSDEEIASVDDDGTVTFNGNAGTVTITASYAGDETYCASDGSYTITVSCPGGAPKVVASGNTVECSSSITLQAKTQADGDFADGTYQWFRNGTEIDGATSSSYTATQAGTYTVARTNTSGCTSLSPNSATVTSESAEPEVTKLVPFQYYHVDKTYSAQMKDRHLFAVKGSAAYGSTGKNFKLELSRNGGAATDITTTASISVIKSADNTVDTVMIDLNKLSGKYSEGDELVVTCKAVYCGGAVSDTYKDNITIHVIGATPTLALICSGTDITAGTRETKKLKVGGDFLTGYNVADLCQQTGNTTFDANTEWGLYTRLKENYIVTPVNGYAVFNKLNYEPFDILLLTDYPKASKSDAAKDVLDDMADLCDYRPMLSFKTHMVAKSPSKWAAKGFTTSATENKADGRLNLNIVCYAHPMFESIKTGENVYDDVANSSAPLVYTMLTGVGHEGSKGMQGFELAAAENFVTIGLTHYNATIAKNSPSAGQVTWTPGTEDRMLVTVAERQTNIEARFILFSLNCGAQSMLTEKGRTVVLACLSYLLETDPLKVADCSFTFDNGEGNKRTPEQQAINCPSCPAAGDGKWSNPANWGPDYRLLPGEFTSVRIKKPVEVDITNAHVMEARIIEEGQITIPASKALEVKSTIRRMEGTEIYPTEANDIVIGSNADGNGSLIFNNNAGDTKARVALYSTAKADVENMSAANSTWQYIGTPHSDVVSATSNYYGSWLYQYNTGSQGWEVIPNGGPLQTFRGYCVTHPSAPVVFDMSGTLAATTSADIDVPANKYVVTANSWVAPIDINKITDDDMEGISDKAIYFFNTGSDSERTGAVTENATGDERWAAGTYVTIPIHSAPYTGTDDHIPSMQGFYVWSTTAGTLHLDYDRHVRGQERGTIVSGRMHAPKRVQAEDNAPEVLWLVARGNHYDDRLVVLEREDFTRNYESGWDGEAWGGSDLSPMVYITNEAGVDEAVSAIPEFEGTVITFRAGEDSEYRFEFTYSEEAEPLYLLDTDNNTYTQVVTGNEYYFTTYDKSPHKRFVLTRKAPQIATGVDQVSSDQVSSTKARKLLIEDKMYILLNGMLYDATGKAVQ